MCLRFTVLNIDEENDSRLKYLWTTTPRTWNHEEILGVITNNGVNAELPGLVFLQLLCGTYCIPFGVTLMSQHACCHLVGARLVLRFVPYYACCSLEAPSPSAAGLQASA